jgi:hypothetical protein
MPAAGLLAERESEGEGHTSALRITLVPYAVSRVLLVAAGVLVLVVLPRSVDVGMNSVFTTWDGAWYVSIAEHGYMPGPDIKRPGAPPGADTSVDGAVAYFPLYPLIVAGLGVLLPVSMPTVAVALSLVVGGAAALAFAKLAIELGSEEAAHRAVLMLCFFPGAFILSFAYPEGMMILLGCLCLLALQRRAWILAGIAAGLGSATRPNGLALTVACGVAAFVAVRDSKDWGSLLAPALAPMGFLAYMAYLWWQSGSPWYWFTVSRVFWHDNIGSWPELHLLLGGSHPDVAREGASRMVLIGGLIAGFLLLSILIFILLRARLPVAVVSYALAYEALALLSQALAPRPRFMLAAFPLVLTLGFALKDRIFHVVLAASSAAMVMLFFFYTVPYLQGRFPVAP